MKRQIIDGTVIESDNPIRIGTGIHGGGRVTRTWNGPDAANTVPKSPVMCRGCHDDFYNRAGTSGCWSFQGAVVCNKVGHSTLNVCNGPDTKMEKTLTCWHGVRK